MTIRFRVLLCVVLAAGAPASVNAQHALPDNRLVVVELFQSQGCSSCPPAEANLNALAGKPDILALSFGVTYWDELGWKDTFATPAYTRRQWDYAHHRHRGTVWTPQVVINGRSDLVGSDRARLDAAIANARKNAETSGPSLRFAAGQLNVGAGAAQGESDVWLVCYDPRTLQVAIGAGENGGRTLPHRNVVRQLVRLGTWNGSARSFKLPNAAPGLRSAALVQESSGGPILSAARLDQPARLIDFKPR